MTERLANCTIATALALAFVAAVASNPTVREGIGVAELMRAAAGQIGQIERIELPELGPQLAP